MPLRLLFLLALVLRLVLLVEFPGVHGDDSAARLAYSDRIVLAYQLPLPQLVVALSRHLLPHPAWTQVAFAVIGALVAPLLAAVVSMLESARAGWMAGLLAAAHPLLVYYSLVPYQEGPMLALLLAAALALLRGREGLAGLCVGLACLCRYEAWIAVAILVYRRRSLRSMLLYGVVPIAWVGLWRGLSPGGTYVLDLDPGAGRLGRLSFLLAKAVEYSGHLLVAAGVIGAAWVLWKGDRRWRVAALFPAAVIGMVVLAGHEFPPGSGRVSERLAHLPVLAMCAAAAVAFARAAQGPRWRTEAAGVAITLVAVGGAHHARSLVRTAHDAPDLRLAQAVAQFADVHLGANGRFAIAAPAVLPASIEDYVRKVEHAGGDTTRARATARELSRLPPDGVRVAAHLPRPAGTVVPAGEPAALLAVFDDSAAPTGPIAARFVAGARNAAVYWTGTPYVSPNP